MKIIRILLFCSIASALHAQNNSGDFFAAQIAPGAQAQLKTLLDNPAMIQPAVAAPLGKNWFRLETDAHVFTDQASVKQVAAVLLDWENQEKYLNGKRSILSATVVSRNGNNSVVDFVSTSFAPMGIRIRTPYRADITTYENSDTRFYVEMKQSGSDSASNDRLKELLATRYAQAVTIDGKQYTYIRIYIINDVNGSILPGARGVLENQSGPANIEALQLIIAAAKTK